MKLEQPCSGLIMRQFLESCSGSSALPVVAVIGKHAEREGSNSAFPLQMITIVEGQCKSQWFLRI